MKKYLFGIIGSLLVSSPLVVGATEGLTDVSDKDLLLELANRLNVDLLPPVDQPESQSAVISYECSVGSRDPLRISTISSLEESNELEISDIYNLFDPWDPDLDPDFQVCSRQVETINSELSRVITEPRAFRLCKARRTVVRGNDILNYESYYTFTHQEVHVFPSGNLVLGVEQEVRDHVSSSNYQESLEACLSQVEVIN